MYHHTKHGPTALLLALVTTSSLPVALLRCSLIASNMLCRHEAGVEIGHPVPLHHTSTASSTTEVPSSNHPRPLGATRVVGHMQDATGQTSPMHLQSHRYAAHKACSTSTEVGTSMHNIAHTRVDQPHAPLIAQVRCTQGV